MWVADTPDRSGGAVVEEWADRCGSIGSSKWETLTGQKIEDTHISCVEETQYANGCNTQDKVFEVPVGKGGVDWPKHYMYKDGKVAFTKENTMIRQCEFYDEGLFEDTLKVFYAEIAKLTITDSNFGYPYPSGPADTNNWKSLFMESELNIQKPPQELLTLIKPDLLALVVTTTPCEQQLEVMRRSGQNPAAWCNQIQGGGKSEAEVIEDSKKAACLVQQQLEGSGVKVPVVEAKLPTNSMTQATWVEWATSKVCECSHFCEIDCKQVLP